MQSFKSLSNFVSKFQYLFWDFDGVIKDTIRVKGEAFKDLFFEESESFKTKILNYHLENQGISRHEKIKEYLIWKKNYNQKNLKHYLDQFSSIVVDKVLQSNWYEDVKDYILINNYNQNHFLLTQTPQEEIESILNQSNFIKNFNKIYGWPNKKSEVIKKIIKDFSFKKKKCIMIGDSKTDLNASRDNKITFLLHLTKENRSIFRNIKVKYYQ